ncbi:hypothetical protein V8G54_017988 [Vigna mungo]|uniref:Protein kinase domain-containing protein n=1 Tax=Vigna mungo TaxID=3915 RepID=A0AAQ3N8T7_VIGMU
MSSPNLKSFTFNELKNATINFWHDNLLDKGGFGCVYKGWIDKHTFIASKHGSGMVVVVKKLKPEGFQDQLRVFRFSLCKLFVYTYHAKGLQEFNAKLSDFGLAKAGPTGDRTHVFTQVMGTPGYAAPEYVAIGRLTAKSDVYSFGVVLLELLSGRRAVDKKTAESPHLGDLAWGSEGWRSTNCYVYFLFLASFS